MDLTVLIIYAALVLLSVWLYSKINKERKKTHGCLYVEDGEINPDIYLELSVDVDDLKKLDKVSLKVCNVKNK